VIAVSRYIARRLEGIVPPERVHVIPNMVDIVAIDKVIAATPESVPAGQPYLLFVGKLERNKGAQLLVDIFREVEAQLAAGSRQRLAIPELVVAGNGPLRAELERELPKLGVRARFLDWVDHDEVLRLMAHCELLLFPSAWSEPLSRVPLEGSACGAAILAMPTGGTPDIIADGLGGALETTPAGFARRLAMLLADSTRRRELGAAARGVAERRFATDVVVRQVEALFEELLEPV
jgi:glycogen synthase